MLTSDLLRVRAWKGEIRPRFIDPGDDELLLLAGRLIGIFREHEGRARQELDRELEDFLGTGTDFLLHRGLAKLLDDRSTFETEAPAEPEALRAALFEASALAYRAPQRQDDPQPFHFDRAAVVRQAAATLELEPAALEQGLYADLRDEQVLKGFDPCKPEWLLERYNVALAQAVLLRASEMTITVTGQPTRAYRELFRKVKFFQLMHRIRPTGDGYEIVLDGPMSLFKASGRYGVKMAMFLPTLLHFAGWELEATVLWGKRRLKKTFTLSPADGLRPHGRLRGQWQPDELAAFPEAFAKLDSPWRLATDAELIDLGGEGVLVPDFSFTHPDGTHGVMEVFGFWNQGAVRSRLRLLERHGPKHLILALSKQLAGGREGLDELPGEVYVFRSMPIARQVLKRLEAFR